MKTERITIENLKCHGCANTIKSELGRMEGVTSVTVNLEDSMVIIDHKNEETMNEAFAKKLAKLGYPEKGNNKFSSRAKSYVSCAIGRVSKHE